MRYGAALLIFTALLLSGCATSSETTLRIEQQGLKGQPTFSVVVTLK